ncbi:MAG: VapC toxin family PIN domain ribonuclease [Sphingomicrobium sp.]
MIIVNTSIWVEYFRGKDTPLDALIGDAPILLHPFVRGELLLHGLPKKGAVRETMDELPPAPVGSPEEASAFIEWAKLAGTGIDYVDTHLLLSARLFDQGSLLTRDKKLLAQATRLGVAFTAA